MHSASTPSKTEKARLALAHRQSGLAMSERSLLIMCDGCRSIAELCKILGTATPNLLYSLGARDYLVSDKVTRATKEVLPEELVASGTRRSLVAAKMYLVGLLQSVRHPGAADLLRQIQSCSDEADLLVLIRTTVGFFSETTPSSYSQRVAQHVLEVLPAAHSATLKSASDAVPAI